MKTRLSLRMVCSIGHNVSKELALICPLCLGTRCTCCLGFTQVPATCWQPTIRDTLIVCKRSRRKQMTVIGRCGESALKGTGTTHGDRITNVERQTHDEGTPLDWSTREVNVCVYMCICLHVCLCEARGHSRARKGLEHNQSLGSQAVWSALWAGYCNSYKHRLLSNQGWVEEGGIERPRERDGG